MRLNPEFYHDFVQEVVAGEDNSLVLVKYFFSGKESLNASKNFMKKLNSVSFLGRDSSFSNIPQYSPYLLKLHWVSL